MRNSELTLYSVNAKKLNEHISRCIYFAIEKVENATEGRWKLSNLKSKNFTSIFSSFFIFSNHGGFHACMKIFYVLNAVHIKSVL